MKIRKRSKGKKDYYYLEHSIRKGETVTKKEKYLGTEVPKDIVQIKKDFLKEIKYDLIDKLHKIKHNFNSEWKKIPESAKKRELEEIAIAFTYNTNAIEGSTITLEETREIIHDKIAPNKSLRDIRETESHAKVFLKSLLKPQNSFKDNFGSRKSKKQKEDFLGKEKINEELFLSWHKEIFNEGKPDLAGKFRDYLVTVGSYLAPDWQDIEKLIKELISFINKGISEKMNPVELSARAHYKFEKIHPFGDGNGRIGRLLMNYILWHSDYPMIIIEQKKRASYYKALRKDEEYFLKYYIRRYLAIHKKRYLK